MSTSLRRTGSVSKRPSATASITNKRGSAYLGAGGPMGMGMDFGAVSPEPLMDEAAALRKIIEGVNKTNAALRAKISDLENHIEHGTGPEVERLSKELSTLEDLFMQTQRDNEAKHAEGERQKAYVKELENLLNTSLGPDWKESHNLYPPAATTTIVTPSTPLPAVKPTPSSSLRHSVSFSKRNTSGKVHRRASSAMDLNLMWLQAVKEDDAGVDDTPTGALRKLNGSVNGNMKVILNPLQDGALQSIKGGSGEPSMPAPSATSMSQLKSTAAPSKSSSATTTNPTSTNPSALAESIDFDQLNTVLEMLSSTHLAKTLSQLQSQTSLGQTHVSAPPSTDLGSDAMDTQLKMIKRMLADQEKRLVEREAKLTSIIQMAEEKERKYELAL
ncbi:hypothetical protein IAT40_001468 [Kwoniella sp. CBS 6097]